MTTGAGPRRVAYYALLWAMSLLFFSPVLWIILSAFKSPAQILAKDPVVIFEPTLANLADAFGRTEFVSTLINSIVLSSVAVVIAVVVSFLAAYSFSRFKPPGTDFLMFLLLSVRMVPAAATIIPIYLMFVALGWKNTHLGLIAFYAMFSIPFSLWILRGFIDGISRRFDETALVNGAGRLHVVFRVVLPQVKPGLMAAFVFNFIFVWNDYLFNYTVGGAATNNVPVTLAAGMYNVGGADWAFISSVTTIYLLPIVVIVFFFQKYLLVGMTFGTVRGEV